MMHIYLKNVFILTIVLAISSCSKSGRKKVHQTSAEVSTNRRFQASGEKTVVTMTKVNGVYEIPTEVNGVSMHFIFDTGAGMISISNIEAAFLYKKGKLKDEDFIGKKNFMDANGDITEGKVVMLRQVKVGNRILENVEASIVPNLQAPLLFGQSALEKFGKVSIDYNRQQITLE